MYAIYHKIEEWKQQFEGENMRYHYVKCVMKKSDMPSSDHRKVMNAIAK